MKRLVYSGLSGVMLAFAIVVPALAHDTPDGSEWVMADWIFITFAIFGGIALVAFVLAYKAGLLSNLEDAKYQILTIEEPDYYSE